MEEKFESIRVKKSLELRKRVKVLASANDMNMSEVIEKMLLKAEKDGLG